MVKVKIVVVGGIAQELNEKRITGWRSSAFEIQEDISHFTLNANPDLPDTRGFSDILLSRCLPTWENIMSNANANNIPDLLLYVLDVPLTNMYYSRILNNNRIVITYYLVKEILNGHKIPLENYLLRLVYSYSLLFMGRKRECLSMKDEEKMTHEDRRGCIYDMCGIYRDIPSSSISPTICEECAGKLIANNVSTEVVREVCKELKGLKRIWYDELRLNHPRLTYALSIGISLIVGIVSGYLLLYLK